MPKKSSKKSFVGKDIPELTLTQAPSRQGASWWIIVILGPLIAVVAIVIALFQDQYNRDVEVPSQPLTHASQLRTLGGVFGEIAFAKDNNTSASCKTYMDQAVKNSINIFPLIPEGMQSKEGAPCPPILWDLNIVLFFAYKLLWFANWLAGALAIILTVWGGLLYMSGALKEENAKTAKTVLISVYTGLIIVLLAKTILYGILQNKFSDNPNCNADSGLFDFIKSGDAK